MEGWKRYVSRYVEGRRVRSVRVSDTQVLRNTSPQGLGRALKGHRLGHPDRHGKWLVIPAGGGHLVVHFGMTGALAWTGGGGAAQPYDRVTLELDGGELHYLAQRKLGGLWWVPERGDVNDVTGALGPDAAEIPRQELKRRLAGRRRAIKSALMDQHILAGIGNELSDEILWRARVRPDVRARRLSERQLDAVFDAMRDVLRRSIKHGRVPSEGRWLNAVRGEEHPVCPRCGAEVRRSKLGGRTAYFCPRCQHGAGELDS